MNRFPRVVAGSLLFAALAGCAGTGMLEEIGTPARDFSAGAPVAADSAAVVTLVDLDATFEPGTQDLSRRFLGRLRYGSLSDTLDLILLGDNRPGERSYALAEHADAVTGIASPNPLHWVRGLVHLPALLVRAFVPDAKALRDAPGRITHQPTYGKEREVLTAALAIDGELRARGRRAAALLNAGDLVEDGRRPAQWRRFLRLSRPMADRAPYLALPGNHEHTEDARGIANWYAATGLPHLPDATHYCFDSADGGLRVLVLDSNPLVDEAERWPDALEDSLAERELSWLEARLGEHAGLSIVALHQPPYTTGRHRKKWERPATRARRARLMRILLASRTFLLLGSDMHAYQRAVLSRDGDERVVVTSGGAGSPLHAVPNATEAADLFAAYDTSGFRFERAEVRARSVFHLLHLRVWPAGGELRAYEVRGEGERWPLDRVRLRFGTKTSVWSAGR